MVESPNSPKKLMRIAFFADDARVYPEELTSLLEKLAADQHRVRCFAPEWPDHVAKLATASGAETDTFPVEIDKNYVLMPQRALRGQVASVVNGWTPDIIVAIGPANALRILPTVKPGHAKRVAILDRFVLDDTAPEIVEPGRIVTDADIIQLAKSCDVIVCHTKQDEHALAAALTRLAPKRKPVLSTAAGYGVNTTLLKQRHLPSTSGEVTFLMTAPLDHWKGVMDYSAAASLVTGRSTNAIFRLQGAAGRTPNAIRYEDVLKPQRIDPVDTTVGMAQAIANAHVLVVASHHDGLPREMLAALA
ncbi:MAG: hypothetical protein AAFR75_11490, partial [Pseudomonadota bacterium]